MEHFIERIEGAHAVAENPFQHVGEILLIDLKERFQFLVIFTLSMGRARRSEFGGDNNPQFAKTATMTCFLSSVSGVLDHFVEGAELVLEHAGVEHLFVY
jgi:hypothetical protein